MNVFVDTSIWPEVFRRKRPNTELTHSLTELIKEHRVILLGPIGQELLSGISDNQKFNLLKDKLAFFPDREIKTDDYVLAAAYNNLCRKKSIQGSHVDFLICACSTSMKASMLKSMMGVHKQVNRIVELRYAKPAIRFSYRLSEDVNL